MGKKYVRRKGRRASNSTFFSFQLPREEIARRLILKLFSCVTHYPQKVKKSLKNKRFLGKKTLKRNNRAKYRLRKTDTLHARQSSMNNNNNGRLLFQVDPVRRMASSCTA